MSRILCFVVTTALLSAVSATAQTSSSSLSGTVADSSNRVIPGANVTLVDEASGEEKQATTSGLGEFVFPALNPGTYTVRVNANGMRPLERKGNVVVSSTRLSVGTLLLQVG